MTFGYASDTAELWLIRAQMNHNLIESFDELLALRHAPELTTLYFEHNPIWKNERYKANILQMFPQLTQLDADEVD